MLLKWLFCLLLAALVSAKYRYDEHQIYRLFPESDIQLKALKELEDRHNELQVLSPVVTVGVPVNILVPPAQLPVILGLIRSLNMKNEILVQDVQKLIDLEKPSHRSPKFGWNSYYDLDELYPWLDSLTILYPDIVTPLLSGYSYEGRPIKGVKVSYKEGNPGVFLESGIHGGEWIAPATATWILNELLTSQDPDVRSIAQNFDWYIFPSVNPDGYHYSHTTERFWKKTRSPVSETCFGVDANRNWDMHWMEGGASSDPCFNGYAGPSAFSENETRSLAEFVGTLGGKLQVYLDFHCYGQMLMFPYGYTDEHVAQYDTLMKIANKTAESLATRYGTQYRVGDIAETIYVASGNSLDWMYEKLNITLTFVYELRDRGETGGLLPPEQIVPSGQETLDSIITLLRESEEIIRQNYAGKK